MRLLSFASFILAIVFVVLLVLSRNANIHDWYQNYIEYLSASEKRVENLENRITVLYVVIFLFIFKALFPLYLYPLSALCAVTSAVFPAYFSIPINVVGLFLLYSLKYYWGTKVGAKGVQTILQKSETVQYLIEKDGQGNPWLLALFRLVPGIPINLVSKLYGAMNFPYRKYVILSLIGYSPLLISYTFIGRNVFNPLSAAFIVPFILLFSLASISLLAISKIFVYQYNKRRKNDV